MQVNAGDPVLIRIVIPDGEIWQYSKVTGKRIGVVEAVGGYLFNNSHGTNAPFLTGWMNNLELHPVTVKNLAKIFAYNETQRAQADHEAYLRYYEAKQGIEAEREAERKQQRDLLATIPVEQIPVPPPHGIFRYGPLSPHAPYTEAHRAQTDDGRRSQETDGMLSCYSLRTWRFWSRWFRIRIRANELKRPRGRMSYMRAR